MKRVLFIAVDSADKDLVLAMNAAGKLPTLTALMQSGTCLEVSTPPGLGNDALWASLYTGVGPASHGRFFPYQLRPGTYRVERCPLSSIEQPMLWQLASDAGHRVAVLDLALAPLSKNLNGVQLVDWTAHEREYDRVLSVPPTLAAKVLDQYGADPVGQCDLYGAAKADAERLESDLIARIGQKEALLREYLSRGEYSFVMTTYHEPHCIGHQAWQWHAPDRSQDDGAMASTGPDPVEAVYAAVFASIGRLLEYVGNDWTTIIFSAPGMGSNASASLLLPEVLRRLQQDASAVPNTTMSLKAVYRNVLPKSARQRARRIADWFDARLMSLGRAKTQAFTVPHGDGGGAIRINLAGREPSGKVNPGAPYETYCRQLISDLHELVDADTGQPAVHRVLQTAELYNGSKRAALEDLIVLWNAETPLHGVRSSKVGEVRFENERPRGGDHRPGGLFLTNVATRDQGADLSPISVMDVAASVAAAAGVTIPSAEGNPIGSFG